MGEFDDAELADIMNDLHDDLAASIAMGFVIADDEG